MQIYHLARRHFGPHSTIGDISAPDGTHVAFTCEDVVREPEHGNPATVDAGAIAAWVKSWKVHGKTAIPYGCYRLAWTFSNRFQRNTLELQSVPGFGGIRIHAGNTDADTEGCILPGLSIMDREAVGNSRLAVGKLEALILPQLKAGPVFLEISKGEVIQ